MWGGTLDILETPHMCVMIRRRRRRQFLFLFNFISFPLIAGTGTGKGWGMGGIRVGAPIVMGNLCRSVAAHSATKQAKISPPHPK